MLTTAFYYNLHISCVLQAPNTPQEYQSLWEQSQPATKLPSLPPHPAKELAPSPAALQARESTSTAVATTARIRNGIASQRTAEDVAEEKVAEEEDYEDGDGTGEQGDRGEAEQEDEVSASTTASSADRRKAKQKRHKENQKLRKKLLQVSSSERSGASDASLNFLQPYQPVQTTAPAIAGGKMKVKVNPITKASATAPPRAATTMHATPPLTVSAPFATAGRTAAVKPPVPRFDGYRQNAAPAASVPTAAPASKNLAAATKSTFKRSQQHTQHTQPSCVQAPTKQVSVLHRSASVNSRQPVKTLKPPSKTSTAASSSNDWYSEDAPF